MKGNIAFIGIGSNIGDGVANCLASIEKIKKDKRAEILSCSSLYRTSPVSKIEQEDFINCAIKISWNDTPFSLLSFLNGIEREMGRIRVIKDGPRTIDLDILLFGDAVIHTPSLIIPHPELHRRKFALVPCIEIDPTLVHPVYKRELKTFLDEIGENQRIFRLTDGH
ncbi:MAG: 2-amino-4-hydroxy-6-hydroxymethyldihydropteridine diphosphokinase [Syntrophorhabdaceae bacterium]|nr:2-amino-4-hydroxy-6-hydroxymethyldihydropteridine diphosphokinase [Syntrophorhabdaceae bacterium]